ncbi:MAG TPA: TonB-dependent receptor [Flavobacteriales bacterium]|nr:TonB-dependent receptor [Flavobacteriales bacterium]
MASAPAFAQDATIEGTVTGAENGEPLIGANIIIDDTTGTASDIDGKFTITVRPGLHKILCKFLGCEAFTKVIEIKEGEKFSLNMALKEEMAELGTVVISAGKFEQKIEDVTVSMQVINPQLVEDKATTNMETAINQTPGVQIIDSEPQIRSGSGYSFGAGSRVMIMVDDLPVLSGDAGRPSWNFLPVENLEQIEIIKGAASVLYGSAALNGIINIRTAYPKDKPETKINIMAGIYDNPSRKYAIYWGDANPIYSGVNFFHSRKIKNLDFVIGGNVFADQGHVGPAPEIGDTNLINLGGTTYQRQQNIGEFENRIRLNMNLRYRPPKYKGLNYGINFNGMYARSAGALLMLNTDTGMYRSYPGAITRTLKSVFNIDPFLNYYGKKGVRHSLRTRLYYVNNDNNNNQANESTMWYGEYQFQKKFEKIKDFTATTGVMNTYSTSRSQLYKRIEYNISDAGDTLGTDTTNMSSGVNTAIYLQLDKKFWERLTLSGGARWESFAVNKVDRDAAAVFRAGLSARVLKATYIRASFGQGFRAPTIAEKYVQTSVGPMKIFPNPNIKSEKSWNAEFGVRQVVKIKKFYADIDVAVFQQEITNSIEFTFGRWGNTCNGCFDDLGFKSINVGKARIRGLDASITGNGSIGDVSLTVMGGYTYTMPVALTPDDTILYQENGAPVTYKNSSTDTTDNILKYRYQHLGKGDINVGYKKFAVGLSFRYNSFMKNVDLIFEVLDEIKVLPTGIKQYREDKNQEGDYVFDFRISYKMTETTKVAFIINNLLNREYMIRPLQIESPRTFGMQFTIKF